MTQACDIIASKNILFGNNVSHSNRKTRRMFAPNLHKKNFFSQSINKNVTLKIAISTLRSIDKAGGLENYLTSAPNKLLTKKAISLKTEINKKKK